MPQQNAVEATLPEWSDPKAKKAAFLAVMTQIAAAPEQFVNNEANTRKAFENFIQVPKDIRLIVLPEADSDIIGGGSMVIQAPAKGSTLDDDQKIELFLCSYPTMW